MDSGFNLEASTHIAYLKLLKCLREPSPSTGLETEGRKVGTLQVTGLESEPQGTGACLVFFIWLIDG